MSDLKSRLRMVADTLMAIPTEPWHFGDSIGFEAMLAASSALGEERWLRYAHGFVRSWSDSTRPYRPLDVTAPGRAMVAIAELTGDQRFLTAAQRLAEDHLRSRRRVAGVLTTWERAPLQHPAGPLPLPQTEVPLVVDPGAGVFVDCLHFDPPLFAALGRALPGTSWSDLAAAEAAAYVELLQDPATGLFWHFYLERTQRTYALGWGRGQGWALLGLLDVLELLPDPHPGRPVLAGAAERLVRAMLERQRADGSWDAVAGVRDSGPESSTAAFMAVGLLRAAELGVIQGHLVDAAAGAALRCATGEVDDNGQLQGVSAAVGACTADSHYRYVPRGFLVHWGQGPLVLALAQHERSANP